MTPPAADARRPRIAASDALRVTALVGVVLIHATAWAPAAQHVFGAVNLVSRYSVPVFMVLTGLVLAYQYAERPVGAGFVRRRASRTVVPWLVWAPLYLAFDLFLIHSLARTPGAVYSWLNQGAGHLWYLLLVPQLYILFAIWPRRHTWLVTCAALAVQVGLSMLRLYGPLPADLIRQVVLVHGFLLFPFWIGYFAVGVAVGRALRPGFRVARRGAWSVLALLAIAGGGLLLLNVSFATAQYRDFIKGTGAFLNPALPPLALAIVALVFIAGTPVLRASAPLNRAMLALSDLSLGIYIIHPMPLFGLGLMLRYRFAVGTPGSFLPLCALVVGSIAVSAVLTRLIAATPLAVIVGMRPRPFRPAWARPRQGAAPAG